MAPLTPAQYYKAQRLFLAFYGGCSGLTKAALAEISTLAGIEPSLALDPRLKDGFMAMLLHEFVMKLEKRELRIDDLWQKCLGGDDRVDKMNAAVMQADAQLPADLDSAAIRGRLRETSAVPELVVLKTRLAANLLVDCDLERVQEQRELQEARKELLWALDMDPAFAKAHLLLGVALLRMDKSSRWAGCTSTRRALMLMPDQPCLWAATAHITRVCGDDAEAELLERAAGRLKCGRQPDWHPFRFLYPSVGLDHLWSGCDGL